METEIDRMDSLNSNGLVNMEQLSELDEVDGLDLDEQQLAEATDEVIFLSWLLKLGSVNFCSPAALRKRSCM